MALMNENLDCSEFYMKYSQNFLPKLLAKLQISAKDSKIKAKNKFTLQNVKSMKGRKDKCSSQKKHFSCEISSKSFQLRSDLERHSGIHSIVKTHKCELCMFSRIYSFFTLEGPHGCALWTETLQL